MLTKCIVVHLADDPRHLPRLQLAVDLAKRFDAHLNVVYANERPDFPAGMIGRAASMAYLDDAEEEEEELIVAIKKEVDEACAGLASWEWHEEHGAVDKLVSRWAHLSDLVLAEQEPHEHIEDDLIFRLSDHLVMSAGCPMLLVPWNGSGNRRKPDPRGVGRIAAKRFRRSEVPLLSCSRPRRCWFWPRPTRSIRTLPEATSLPIWNTTVLPAEVIGAAEKGGKKILQVCEQNRM